MYAVDEKVTMKKPHPCGNKQFKILRVGSEMRILCTACGRDLVIDRVKLEKATKKIYSQPSEEGVSRE